VIVPAGIEVRLTKEVVSPKQFGIVTNSLSGSGQMEMISVAVDEHPKFEVMDSVTWKTPQFA